MQSFVQDPTARAYKFAKVQKNKGAVPPELAILQRCRHPNLVTIFDSRINYNASSMFYCIQMDCCM